MKLKCLKKLCPFALFFSDPWPKIIFFCVIVFGLILGLSIWTLFGCVFVMEKTMILNSKIEEKMGGAVTDICLFIFLLVQ